MHTSKRPDGAGKADTDVLEAGETGCTAHSDTEGLDLDTKPTPQARHANDGIAVLHMRWIYPASLWAQTCPAVLLGGPAHLIMNGSMLLFCAGGSPGASDAGIDAEGADKGRSRDNDPLDELQQDEVCHPLAACTVHMYNLPDYPPNTRQT